jgi:hypothetical protein
LIRSDESDADLTGSIAYNLQSSSRSNNNVHSPTPHKVGLQKITNSLGLTYTDKLRARSQRIMAVTTTMKGARTNRKRSKVTSLSSAMIIFPQNLSFVTACLTHSATNALVSILPRSSSKPSRTTAGRPSPPNLKADLQDEIPIPNLRTSIPIQLEPCSIVCGLSMA